MEKNVCEICINIFNYKCKKVNCSCNYNCCIKCAKKYFTEINEIKCMNCKKEWDRTFLVKNFGKIFINKEYKIFREDILFKREERMFQATQPYIEKDDKLNMINLYLSEKLNEENNISCIIYNIRNEEDIKLQEKISILKKQSADIIYNKIKYHNNNLNKIKTEIYNLKQEYKEVQQLNINNFILPTNIKCRNNDCNGNLNENFYCNLCKMNSCNLCFEIKENNVHHICDVNKLETIEYIKKHLQIKPCPICNIDISLGEGCNDMFCSICKTTFNFKTLKITKGNTNEDYKAYIQILKNESQYNDTICPSELDEDYNMIIFTRTNEINEISQTNFIEFNNFIQNIKNVVINLLIIKNEIRKHTHTVDEFHRTLWLRKSYMNKTISKSHFKIEIQKIDKDYSKREELVDILTTYIESVSDKLNWFMIQYTQIDKSCEEYIKDLKSFFNDINVLISITNNAFIQLSNVYNCKIYRIDEQTFELH